MSIRVQFDDAEALAHQVDPAVPGEDRGQLVVSHAVDLYVEILGWVAQERIPNRSAHHHGPIAGRVQLPHDLAQERRKIEPHRYHHVP